MLHMLASIHYFIEAFPPLRPPNHGIRNVVHRPLTHVVISLGNLISDSEDSAFSPSAEDFLVGGSPDVTVRASSMLRSHRVSFTS